MWGQPPQLAGERNFAARRRPHKFVRTLSLPLPMLDAKVFLKLLQLDLNAHPPGAPIMKIHLAAEPARPRSAQGGFSCLRRRTGKTGTHPGPHRRHCRRTESRSAGVARHAPSRRISHAPLRCRSRAKNSAEENPDSPEAKSAVTALRRFRPPLRANVTLENGQPCIWYVEEKRSTGQTCSGRPAPGASPAIGGSAKPGPATNGTLPCETAKPSRSTALCTTCSAAVGLWKERMTENAVAQFSVTQFSEKAKLNVFQLSTEYLGTEYLLHRTSRPLRIQLSRGRIPARGTRRSLRRTLSMPAMALLDTDGVYGSPRFHLAAKKTRSKRTLARKSRVRRFHHCRFQIDRFRIATLNQSAVSICSGESSVFPSSSPPAPATKTSAA